MRTFAQSCGLIGLLACSNATRDIGTDDTDADTDTDTGTDTDTDTDTEADADVVLNELLASNDTVNADEDGGFDDWVELYNAGSEAADIGGWKISDGGLAKAYTLPVGTTIPAGGYLLIWCDDDGAGLHTDFKLSSNGETVSLWNGADALIDEVAFPSQTTDLSYARVPNGADTWVSEQTPTPEAAN